MSVAIYYLQHILPAVRAAARGCGYAVGLHGSMQRDLDLIAAPWTADAKSAADLAAAVKAALPNSFVKPHEDDGYHRAGKPGLKPHGRLCWTFHLGGGAYVDLSVMPRAGDPDFNDPDEICRRVEETP